jgi:GT2 family glycosyltransferase
MKREIDFPKVSIIVNSYRDFNKLKGCLEELSKSEYPNKEIIVVTYGIPPQKIRKSLSSFYNRLIVLKKDYGLPAQRNIGFKFADSSSKYILFIDDDVLLDKNALKNLIYIAQNFPEIGMAQPLLITPDGFVDCAGAYIDLLGYSYNPFRGLPLSSFPPRKEFYDISYGAGACLMLRAEIFRYDKFFKPFDPMFYFNYEDVDLALRVWLKGYRVVCIPSAKAIHQRGRTSKMKVSPPHLIYLNTRNKFITIGSILGLRYLLVFTFFETIKSLYLFKIDSYHALATLRGILDGILNFNIIIFRKKYLNNHNKIKQLLKRNIIIKPIFSVLIDEFKKHYS